MSVNYCCHGISLLGKAWKLSEPICYTCFAGVSLPMSLGSVNPGLSSEPYSYTASAFESVPLGWRPKAILPTRSGFSISSCLHSTHPERPSSYPTTFIKSLEYKLAHWSPSFLWTRGTFYSSFFFFVMSIPHLATILILLSIAVHCVKLTLPFSTL